MFNHSTDKSSITFSRLTMYNSKERQFFCYAIKKTIFIISFHSIYSTKKINSKKPQVNVRDGKKT